MYIYIYIIFIYIYTYIRIYNSVCACVRVCVCVCYVSIHLRILAKLCYHQANLRELINFHSLRNCQKTRFSDDFRLNKS